MSPYLILPLLPLPHWDGLGQSSREASPQLVLAHREPTLNYSLFFRISTLSVFGEGDVREDRSPRHLNLPKVFRRQVYTIRPLLIERE